MRGVYAGVIGIDWVMPRKGAEKLKGKRHRCVSDSRIGFSYNPGGRCESDEGCKLHIVLCSK